jgi:hypothetical protein
MQKVPAHNSPGGSGDRAKVQHPVTAIQSDKGDSLMRFQGALFGLGWPAATTMAAPPGLDGDDAHRGFGTAWTSNAISNFDSMSMASSTAAGDSISGFYTSATSAFDSTSMASSTAGESTSIATSIFDSTIMASPTGGRLDPMYVQPLSPLSATWLESPEEPTPSSTWWVLPRKFRQPVPAAIQGPGATTM